MRSISAAALAKIVQTHGAEPINIIEVQWAVDGARSAYADRDIDPGVQGRILEISDLDAVVQVSGGSDSQEISVTLLDPDGELKTILDTVDVHKRPVWVYQWFDGIPLNDKFLLFKGQVSSPVVWDEGARTLAFTIISKIEDVEVGFSMEEGDFPDAPQDLIGKPWPLCFGTVLNVPALQLRPPRSGLLGTGNGIRNPTLALQILAAAELQCVESFIGFQGGYQGTQLVLHATYANDPVCRQNREDLIADLEFQYAQELQYEFPTMRIFGGEKFPQGTQLTLDVNSGLFTGYFTGETFTITSREHPDLAGFLPLPTILEFADFPDVVEYQGILLPQEPPTFGQDQYNSIPTSNFFWANPGARVVLAGEEEIIYIANILPSTVLKVAAYRDFDGFRQLVTVPTTYYTARVVDYDGYQVTEIVFSRPLSRRGDGWTDDIYVTLTSSVGPNTVDILQWFIATYTDFGIDAASFADVRTKIDNYPMHFALLERKNIIAVLEELAYQARCAIWLRDDTFFLKYLSEDPVVDDTITEDDIVSRTMQLYHTDTEDLVTKYIADWTEDYANDDPYTVILRHNVNKYGVQEQNYDYYAYNIYSLILKSATFWLIRGANTWRKLRFSTNLQKLRVETFDTVQVSLPDLGEGTIKCVVEKANYNSAENQIDFEVWTPVLAGTRTPYNFAWPAAIAVTELFPTDQEREAGSAGSGSGPSFETRPPTDHPLSPQFPNGITIGCHHSNPNTQLFSDDETLENRCRPDQGDAQPTDIGDTKPTPRAVTDTGAIIPAGSSPVRNSESTSTSQSDCCETAREALRTATQALDAATRASQASGADDPEEGEDELPDPDDVPGCKVEVIVRKQVILMVGTEEGFSTESGDCGIPVQGGPEIIETIAVKTAEAAQQLVTSLQEAGEGQEYCVGTEAFISAAVGGSSGGSAENGFCAETDENGDSGLDEDGNAIIVGQRREGG